MKVLCCIESYLPGTRGGGPVRALSNLVEQLSDTHSFSILTRNHDYLDPELYQEVEHNIWLIERDASICYASGPKWECLFIEAVQSQRPDWIYLQGALAPLTRKVLLLRKKYAALEECRILIAPHGNLSVVSLNHHSLRKRIWLWYAACRKLYKGVVWHAASRRETDQIRACFGPDTDVREVPMAPGRGRKHDVESGEYLRSSRSDHSSLLRLVYFGRLAPEKNLKFAFDILSEFGAEHLECRVSYDIIGSGDARYESELREYAQRAPSNVEINFLGPMAPEALSRYLHQPPLPYHGMLMPSRTENFSYTVLESFQVGVPVLISDQTPWCDLQYAGVGWDLPLGCMEQWQSALSKLNESSCEENYYAAKKYARAWIARYPEQADKLFELG